jgi:soluble cytochrome b562
MGDQCKCSFAIRMVGDGCRHCQPQTYIDALELQAKDYQEYTDGLVEQLDSAIKTLRRARLALAAAASRMPEFDSDYQQVDSFILLHDTNKRGA